TRFRGEPQLGLPERGDVTSPRELRGDEDTTAQYDDPLAEPVSGSGPLKRARFTGTVEGDALKVEAAQYGVALKDGRLRARLSDDVVNVSEFSFAAGE